MDVPQSPDSQRFATPPSGIVLERPVAVGSAGVSHPRPPGWRDVLGIMLVIGILGLMGTAGHQLAVVHPV